MVTIKKRSAESFFPFDRKRSAFLLGWSIAKTRRNAFFRSTEKSSAFSAVNVT
jgi:hypothetical protein